MGFYSTFFTKYKLLYTYMHLKHIQIHTYYHNIWLPLF